MPYLFAPIGLISYAIILAVGDVIKINDLNSIIFARKIVFCFIYILSIFTSDLFAACGGTTRTWAGTSTTWNTAANWSGSNVPNTASEDVVMTSTGFNAAFATSYSLGCLSVLSGTINGTTNNVNMIITGDSFAAPCQNSLNFTSASFRVDMAGTSAQSFEAVDDIRDLRISNTTTVTLKNNFRILSDLTLVGSGTTIIEGFVTTTNAITIPSGHKIIIKNGGVLASSSNITINGTLSIEGGGELRMANGRTLSVPAAGALEILGSAGNPATVSSANASSRFGFIMAGSVRANYAIIRRTVAAGMNVSGTIFQLDHTDFRGMINSGYGMTLGAAAVVPLTLDTIGFFNDDAVATPKNINANAYNLGTVTLNSTSGDVSGSTFELDPNNKIIWGTIAGTELTIANDTETNEPTATLAVNIGVTFAEFAFTLNQVDTATNVTEVILTMTGTATMSDLTRVQVYRDINANCDYDAGTDTQIGSNLIFTGSPLKATVTIPSGQLTTNSPSQQACLIVRATAGAAPVDQRTIKFSIVSSSDVTNSQTYPLSSVSGTPISSGSSILINNTFSTWEGSSSTAWNTTANWTPATVPTATRDCKIGLGTRTTLVNVNPVRCGNATLQSSGTLDFNNTANVFEITNSIDVDTGFNFVNSASGGITMKGTVNQSMGFQTAFPGNVIINNTGVSSNTVSLSISSTINGNLTCTAGILNIPNGVILTVLGNVTIQTGCTIAVGAGGTLAMANNKTLTVNTGGIFQIVGNSGSKATITSNTGAAAYNVIVNGTIKARYYTFDHLNTTGVSIEAGATIDATNYLQNGTFSYPVNSSTTLLKLKRQIPGNALSDMNFTLNSSSASSVVNIDTTGAAAGTLSVTNYAGNIAGESFDLDPSYSVDWTGELNTIAITQEASSPTTVLTGATYNMGRFGLQQVYAGSSYSDTNVTSMSFSLTGTGTATDITEVRLYSDVSCSGSGGSLLGTGTFSGNPAKVTFAITAGNLVVPSALITTSKVCTYVEFVISSSATNGNTVGLKLNSSSDFVNSLNYAPSSGTSFPVTLGAAATISAPTTTTWTGTTSTAWNVASNWTAGVPTSTINCIIPNTALDPIISVGVASCKNFVITTGILVVNAGTFLDIYGDFTKTAGTLTNNGTLSIKDGGNNIYHNLISNSTITNLTLAKTGTGTVYVNQASLTITTLVFSSATTTLEIESGKTLILPNNITIAAGELKITGGGTLEMANGRTITVAGGTFRIAGTADSFPQNIASKGVVQVTGGGANSYSFTATSGTVDLVGFQFDRLGVNGLNIGGSTVISNLSGGQLTNLSTTYASVKAIQINTSGSIPATATNVGWSWGAFNSFNPANVGTPTSASAYKLISSTGCASQSIDFTGWTGDWYESQPTFDVSTKVSTVASCTVNLGASASAISLLSLEAVAFNGAIDLRWRTNAERTHLGFNVYKSDLFSAQFQQVNKSLIRNLKNSGSNQVSYRFIDQDVTNNQIYYYYIEDVDINGKKVLHGPVSATPLLALGTPPADNAGENSETNPNDTDDGGATSPAPIPNPSYEDLGNGVVILSKTSKSLRIKITPGAPVFNQSSWDTNFQDVFINGYSKMTISGSPELVEKDILIEVQSFAETAAVIGEKITVTSLSGHNITPAPNYSLNGSGVLVPVFSPDATRYGNPDLFPSNFYTIQTGLVSVNKTKFLKLKVNPLKLNPVSHVISMASEIILDIGLNGDDWDVTPPAVNSNIGPYSVGNALRIDYEKSGVYQISYQDLIDSEVEGPFKNTAINTWRLYNKDQEIPVEIFSSTGFFTDGDYIRFYVPFKNGLESKKNQLILSPIGLDSASNTPKRIELLNSDPTGQTEFNEVLNRFTKVIEQNLKFIDGFTLNDELDHYFFADLVNFPGMDSLNTTIAMPEIDIENSENVAIKYHVRGRLGLSGFPVKHHVMFSVAGVEEGEVAFTDNTRQVLTFEVPADRFLAGNNLLSLKVLGSYAPASDYDFVLVDKIEISYNGYKNGSSGASHFSLLDSMRAHSITNFLSAEITGYDITLVEEPKKLSNMNITSYDSGATYRADFFVDGEVDEENQKHFYFLTETSFLKPSGLSLNPGIEVSLKNTSNRADLIVYGEEKLIQALDGLIERRRSQGLEVMTVTPAQVYGEFSYGVQSSKSLKTFINTALNNWEKAPRFLLILGDASVDPKDFNVGSLPANERSALEKGTLPAPILPGRFIDFSSDNYYATTDITQRPRLAVGRLPTNNPEFIEMYANKVKNYEEGTSSPSQFLRKITFFADEDTGSYERFNQLSKAMMTAVDGFETSLYDRSELGSKEITKTKMINEFNRGPYLISMMGHGAFDRFGDDVFNVGDVQNLTNTTLPIVVNWNCEGAYFYDANKTYKSMGEELIFNPNGGAILYLGSTTQTTPPAQAKLANLFFTQLSSTIKNDSAGQTIGGILFEAKIGVGLGSYEKDVVNSFSIIGDPSLMIPAQLFPVSKSEAPQVVSRNKSFFSCNANAGTGVPGSPWHEGLIEWILYISLMLYGSKMRLRKGKV